MDRFTLSESKIQDFRLVNAFKEIFGEQQYNDINRNYKANKDDLFKCYCKINEIAFNGQLPNDVNFQIKKQINCNIKGGFGFVELNKDGKTFISEKQKIIIYYDELDCIQRLLVALMHEMIHYLDFKVGELKSHTNKLIGLSLDELKRTFDGEYVGKYDSHGKFFEDAVANFEKFGFIVRKVAFKGYVRYMIDESNKHIAKKFFENEKPTSERAMMLADLFRKTIKNEEFIDVEANGDRVYVVMT